MLDFFILESILRVDLSLTASMQVVLWGMGAPYLVLAILALFRGAKPPDWGATVSLIGMFLATPVLGPLSAHLLWSLADLPFNWRDVQCHWSASNLWHFLNGIQLWGEHLKWDITDKDSQGRAPYIAEAIISILLGGLWTVLLLWVFGGGLSVEELWVGLVYFYGMQGIMNWAQDTGPLGRPLADYIGKSSLVAFLFHLALALIYLIAR